MRNCCNHFEHKHHQCKDGSVFTFTDLNPIPYGTMPDTTGTSGIMYYSGGKFWRMDATELAFILSNLLPTMDVTWEDIQKISLDTTDIKFVFPPQTGDPFKFALRFDPTNTLNLVAPLIAAALDNYTVEKFPQAFDDNVVESFINKHKDGNCTVTPNSIGGFDINYTSASPVDIAGILTPEDISKTPILFTAIESGNKVDNAFNVPVFNAGVANALVLTQEPSIASDLTISVEGGKVSYVLRTPIPTFKDNNDFAFNLVPSIRSGNLRATQVYEGSPNWSIPNKYTDDAVQNLAKQVDDYVTTTLTPLITKVNEELYPWLDSPSFTVAKVDKDGTTYYQGTANGGSGGSLTPDSFIAFVDAGTSNVVVTKHSDSAISLNAPDALPWLNSGTFTVDKVEQGGVTYYQGTAIGGGGALTPDAFIAIVDQGKSNVTVAKDGGKLTLNAVGGKPTAEDVNSVIKQDGNTTTSVIDGFLSILPNWLVPKQYTDQQDNILSEAITQVSDSLTYDVNNLQEQINAITEGDGVAYIKAYTSFTPHDQKEVYHGNLTVDNWNKFCVDWNWDKSLVALLPAPSPTKGDDTETLDISSYASITSDKMVHIQRTYYYVQVGGANDDGTGLVLGYVNPTPGNLVLDCSKLGDDYVTIKLAVRQNKARGEFNINDSSIPDAWKWRYLGVSGLPANYNGYLGINIFVKTTTKADYNVCSMRTPSVGICSTRNKVTTGYSEQLPIIVIRANKNNWFYDYDENTDPTKLVFLYDSSTVTGNISSYNGKTIFLSNVDAFNAFVNSIKTGTITRDGNSTFSIRFSPTSFDTESKNSNNTACRIELQDWDFTAPANYNYMRSTLVYPDETLELEVKIRYDNIAGTLLWDGGRFAIDASKVALKLGCYLFDIINEGGPRFSGNRDVRSTYNFITNTSNDSLFQMGMDEFPVANNNYQIFPSQTLHIESMSRYIFGDKDLMSGTYLFGGPGYYFSALITGSGRLEAYDVPATDHYTVVVKGYQRDSDTALLRTYGDCHMECIFTMDLVGKPDYTRFVENWGYFSYIQEIVDAANRNTYFTLYDTTNNIFQSKWYKAHKSIKIEGWGYDTMALEIPLVSKDGSLLYLPPYTIRTVQSGISFVRLLEFTYGSTRPLLAEINHDRTKTRYDSIEWQDDKSIIHGDLNVVNFNAIAQQYNVPSESIQVLPTPGPITLYNEIVRVTPTTPDYVFNIARTFYYFQLGSINNGIPRECEGTTLDVSEDAPTDQYATVRLLVRQNKAYGTFSWAEPSTVIPDAYKEGAVTEFANGYKVGAEIRIQTTKSTYVIASLKQYLARWMTSTTTVHAMYSEQLPMIIIKCTKNDWYLGFEEEDDLTDVYFQYARTDFSDITSITILSGKTIFFSTFGAFKAFVNAIMALTIPLSGSSTFRCRFNVADYDTVNENPLPCCFEYELKNWNFTHPDKRKYLGSIFVSPKNLMVIEVTCTYNNTTGELYWDGHEFELEDSEIIIKELCIAKDRYIGGTIDHTGSSLKTATYNFITNTQSDLLANFGLDPSADGGGNKYIMNIYKYYLQDNKLNINIGDIDFLYYWNDVNAVPPAVGQIRTLLLKDETITPNQWLYLNIILLNKDMDSININEFYSPLLTKALPHPEGWGHKEMMFYGGNYQAGPNGGESGLPDNFIWTYEDATNYMTQWQLTFRLVRNNGHGYANKIAEIILPLKDQLSVYKYMPPYKVVLAWDSALPNQFVLKEFSYNAVPIGTTE